MIAAHAAANTVMPAAAARPLPPLNAQRTADRQHQMRLAIELAVCRVFGLDYDAIRHGSRGVARIARARQVAMYLAHVGCGLTMKQAGELFGRDRTTVAHACLIVENRRDDPNFDRALDLLEWAVPVMVLRPASYLQQN